MAIRELIESLFSRSRERSGFNYKADKDDVSFYLPRTTFADCEAGKGDELPLTQYIHFKMLEEQGLAESFPNGFAMEPEDVVHLEPDLRFLFGLPDFWPGSFEIITEGNTFHPSYRLELRLRDVNGNVIMPYRLEGPFLRISEAEIYLPSPAQWVALKAVADHQMQSDDERSEYRNLLAIHHLQKAAEAGCDIDLRHFNTIKTAEPERVSVSVEVLPNGDLELTPNFAGIVSPDQVATRLGQIAPDSDAIQSLRIGNTIILLDEKRLKATQEILKNRHIESKYAKQFFASPTVFLDATQIDLDIGYSVRVQGVTAFKHAYFGETEASEIDWFHQATTGRSNPIFSPESIGTLIQDVTDLEAFRMQMSDAVEASSSQLTFKDQVVSIADRAVVERVLNDIEQEFLTRDGTEHEHETPCKADVQETSKASEERLVVDTLPNDEVLDIRSRFSDSLAEKHLYAGELTWQGYERQPFPHQETGIRWLLSLAEQVLQHLHEESLFGSLLADDMGLGKTFMALAAVREYYELCETRGVTKKPVLVVAPLSLVGNWKTEVEQTFAVSPFVDIVTLHGDADLGRYRLPGRGIEIRNQNPRDDLGSDDPELRVILSLKIGEQFGPERLDVPDRLVLTNYDTLANYQFSLCRVDWSFVIFDEAQNIKNPNTIQTRAAKGLKAQFKLMVTGTPVENQLTDFWCIFDTAVPGLLDSYQSFRQTYVRPLLRAGESLSQVRQEVGRQLRARVGALMLRRIKEDHLHGLPEKRVYVGIEDGPGDALYLNAVDCMMSGAQLDTYNTVIDATVQAMAGDNGAGYFLTGLQRLRDVSLHPDLLGDTELPLPATVRDCYTVTCKSGKLSALLNVLDDLRDRQEKVLIFLINKRLQVFLRHVLGKIYAMPVAVINGDTKAVAKQPSVLTRQRLIEQFEARDGFGMLIMSPVAAGVGLTITAANNVIHLERHWNPAKEDQATDRVYRIGQTRDVSVFIPILHHPNHDSFDVHLHRLLAKKIDLKDAIMAPEIVTQESFQQTGIFGQLTCHPISRLSEDDLNMMGWRQFEALIAEILCREFDGDALLTLVSNDKGCDVVLTSARHNVLVQCKYTKHHVLQGDMFIREIFASRRFYETRLGKEFDTLAVFTNAKKIGRQGQAAAASHEVQLHERAWIVKRLRQYSITKFDVLRRLDQSRLSI